MLECEHHKAFMKDVRENLRYIRDRLDKLAINHEGRLVKIETIAKTAKWVFGAMLAIIGTTAVVVTAVTAIGAF